MAYNGCDGFVSKGKNNAAKSRFENTKREIKFLANTYYDYCKFAFSSGYCNDFASLNRSFEETLNRFVSNGKIKRESYNKFIRIFNATDKKALNGPKERFVDDIVSALITEETLRDNTRSKLNDFYNSFTQLLSKNGINMNKTQKDITYVCLVAMILEATGDDDTIIADLENKFGLRGIRWETPKIVTASDGCSLTTWGSAIKHFR